MQVHRTLWFALALSIWFTAARAQTPSFVPQPASERIDWPTSAGTPAFERLVASDFDLDGARDVITLSGTQPVFLWDVAFHATHLPLACAANDIDLARGAGADGRDALAVVGSAGLELWWIAAPPLLTFTSTVLETEQWSSARAVRCGDIDANGSCDYVGVDFLGTTILRRYAGDSVTEQFAVPRGVLDLGLLQWDSDAALEAAVLSDDAVRIHELDGAALGALIITYPNDGLPGGAITVVKGVLRDRVAWAHGSASGPVLMTLRRGMLGDGPYALPSGLDFHSLSTGDADGDGDFDLLLAHDGSYACYFIENVAPSLPWFGELSSAGFIDEPFLAGTPASNAACAPSFNDFDGDGRGDLLLAMQQTTPTDGELPAHVFLAGTPDPVLPAPTFLERGYLCEYVYPELTSRLFLRLKQPHSIERPTHVDLYVWRESYAHSTLEENVVSWTRHGIPGDFPWTSAGPSYIALDLGLPEDAPCFDTGQIAGYGRPIYWFEVHPIKIVDNVVVAAWPWRVGAASSSSCDLDTYLMEFDDQPFPLVGEGSLAPFPGLSPAQLCPMELCADSGSTPAPQVVNRRRIAKFAPNVAPTLPVAPTPAAAHAYTSPP